MLEKLRELGIRDDLIREITEYRETYPVEQEYGSRIPDVAFEIQNRVKKSVENMTGLKVAEVNVHVKGVKTEREENNSEENEEPKEE